MATEASVVWNKAGEERIPRAFGRLWLLRRLARGGMGEVYLAATSGIEGAERPCVVKIIRRDHAADKSFLARFFDEARVQAQLQHHGVAQVLEAATDTTGEPYVVVEYVEGRSLGEVRARASHAGVAIEWPDAVALGVSAAEALAHVHERTDSADKPLGIVHRDLSPQNIMIGYGGDLKLIDFGTARAENRRCHTISGVVFAKPGYVAPEVAAGTPGDSRVDLYALGIILWELLAGRRFLEGDPTEHLALVAKDERRPPPVAKQVGAPPRIDDVIAKLTAHKMEDRYESARHVATDLVKLLATCAPLPNGERGMRARTAHMMQRLYPSEPAKSRAEFDSLVKAARWAGSDDSPSSPVASAELVKSPVPGAAPVMQMQVQTPLRSPLPPPRSPLQSITDGDPNVLVGTRYRILGIIGSGAMGTVYEAQHVDLLRRVALKVLSQDRAMITDVAAFRREAQAIANVLHPNLVMIHDFGESADGRPYCAMELLDGETLEQRLIQDVRLDWREAAKIGILACRGLEAAHAVGVVHCDLKPANLFLTKGPTGEVGIRGQHTGELKILDFGIAHRASEVHTPSESEGAFAMTGTPEYMAPEQARSGTVDARADVYALACVLYELCTGRRPFVAGSPVELVGMKRKAAPESMRVRSRALGLPASLDRIVLRALAPNPRDRQANAEELRLELEQVLRAPRRRRAASHWVGYASIAGAGLFALSAFGVMEWAPGGAGLHLKQALVSALGNRAFGAATELGGRARRVLDAAKALPTEARVLNLDDPAESAPPAPVATGGEHPANGAPPPPGSTMGDGVTASQDAERTPPAALANPEAHGATSRDQAITHAPTVAEGLAKSSSMPPGNATAIHAAVAKDHTPNGGHGASGASNGGHAADDAPKANGAPAGSAVAPSTSPKSEIASLPSALPGSADPIVTGLGAGAAALADGFSSQALLIHRDLAERHPRDARVLRAYAESAAAAQEWKEAAIAAENWSLADSGVEPRLFYVRMLGYGGKPRAARRMLEDILEAHPECDEARALMADYRANAGPAPKPVNVRADRSQTNGPRGEVGARP
jgi:serine/threonine-protein kinase